jgi:hypothetical protein
MSESELFDGTEPVVETEEGFRDAAPADPSAIDSEVDFDDEEYGNEDELLLDEEEAGNAEGGQDAHLDDPEKVGDDSTW